MRFCRFLIVSALSVMLSGCFEGKTVIRVNPDGSGTISETTLFSKKMVTEIKEFTAGLRSDLIDPSKLKDQATFKERAKSMGEGVRFRSGEKAMKVDFSGYTVIYDFDDITKLTLFKKEGPAHSHPSQNNFSSSPIAFDFIKGSPATLIVIQAPEEAPRATEKTPAHLRSPTEAESKKAAELIKGFKFEVGIEVNGTIVETNASQRNRNYLTLMALDLDKIAGTNPELVKFSYRTDNPSQWSRSRIKDIPGVKVETEDIITVVFE